MSDPNLSPDEYFSHPATSNTQLGWLAESAEKYRYKMDNPSEKTKAMELGSDFHDLALLAHSPQNVVIKPPGMSFTTREGKAWRAEQDGKRIMEAKDHASMWGMFESVMRNRGVRATIEKGQAEVSLFAPYESLMRKGRLDLIPPTDALLDFKTTTDASQEAFSKTIYNMGYHRQAAYYLDLAEENGLEQTHFVFVAIEKEAPYACAVWHLDQAAVRRGREEYQRLLALLMYCRERNEWPGYPEAPQSISLPRWAFGGAV